jgi:HEPN domain-containing protein
MDQAAIDSTQRWMTKASHDLVGARKSAGGDDISLDVAVYHCQQAGEKALKAFLVAHSLAFPKTHSLVLLLPMCEAVDAGFQKWKVEAAFLSPLAFAFRYPDDFAPLNPTRAQFDEAYAAAQRIYDFVLSQLPKETHPA